MGTFKLATDGFTQSANKDFIQSAKKERVQAGFDRTWALSKLGTLTASHGRNGLLVPSSLEGFTVPDPDGVTFLKRTSRWTHADSSFNLELYEINRFTGEPTLTTSGGGAAGSSGSYTESLTQSDTLAERTRTYDTGSVHLLKYETPYTVADMLVDLEGLWSQIASELTTSLVSDKEYCFDSSGTAVLGTYRNSFGVSTSLLTGAPSSASGWGVSAPGIRANFGSFDNTDCEKRGYNLKLTISPSVAYSPNFFILPGLLTFGTPPEEGTFIASLRPRMQPIPKDVAFVVPPLDGFFHILTMEQIGTTPV